MYINISQELTTCQSFRVQELFGVCAQNDESEDKLCWTKVTRTVSDKNMTDPCASEHRAHPIHRTFANGNVAVPPCMVGGKRFTQCANPTVSSRSGDGNDDGW